MSPINKTLLILLISGLLFTLLLTLGQPKNSEVNSTAAAQQLSLQFGDNIKALSLGISDLSNNSSWQNTPIAEWPHLLSTQKSIYKAAGLSLLGVHAKSSDILYMQKMNRPGQFFELQTPLQRLYKNKVSVQIIQTYKEQPAVVLLFPIKTVDNEIIGSLIGIKLLDISLLKTFHYRSKLPTAIIHNNDIFQLSIDTSPDVSSFNLVEIEWPETIKSSVWRMVLMEKKTGFLVLSFWRLFFGLLISVTTIILIWKQLRIIQNAIHLLSNSLNIELPITEQIKQLNDLANNNSDPFLLSCTQSIRNRFQQLIQQKKSLSLEVRKLQERETKLLNDKSEVEMQRDSAVAAPRLKSQFLSRMGDEITTPMKSVVSMLKLLSEYPFEDEPKQLLNIAKRSTRTLVDNLNNILDFSKLDANMLHLKPKSFNVRELIDDLSSELSHFANEKELSLQASSDMDVPHMITADAFRIRQILRNLLGNAIRFTKSGEVTLYADMSAKGGNKLLRFTIADTGIGMSTEAQKEIFDSLQQTTKLSNSSFAGRLRLIVSKHLTELMGGEIGVISQIGQGSQFWFTITYKD